ncbi:MAG: hypothetical protein JNM17_38890 [Archangium sp.]|nr:hypothetical protein [Archangium sp.]
MKWVADLLKVSRPGFWPTQLWFFVLPFGQRDMFGTPEFWLGCVYVTFPLGLLLYGWNDIFDAETDRANGLDDAGLARLPRWIIATQLPFVVAFTVLAGPKMLLWALAVAGTNALYRHSLRRCSSLGGTAWSSPPRMSSGRPASSCSRRAELHWGRRWCGYARPPCSTHLSPSPRAPGAQVRAGFEIGFESHGGRARSGCQSSR